MRSTFALAICFASAAGPSWGACNSDLLTVTDWSIRKIDAGTNELVVTLKSEAEKPIRMIDGQYGFRDALGGRIASAAIERDASLPPSGETTITGLWGPFTFERLLTLKKEEVEPYTCVRAVLYDDGTKEEFR